jgi:transcriptional regulator with XRE-family HTH domain
VKQDWADSVHRRTAAAIKKARAQRPANWLADETRRLGYPISRAAIANYESGRKKGLDVAELLVLAAALKVPPLALMFPQLPDGPVEVLPGVETTSWNAAAWFTGEDDALDSDDENYSRSKELELVRAVRERRSQLLTTAKFFDYIQQFARTAKNEHRVVTPRDPTMRALTEQLEALRDEIIRLDKQIRENDGVIDDD